MVDSPARQGRAAKRIKLVGRDSYGKIPKVFLDGDDNIVKMEFDIHDFPNLARQKRGRYFYTGIINAHGYPWSLKIFPGGSDGSKIDVEHVSIFLAYAGENTETNPVVAKAFIRTRTINWELPKHEYYKKAKQSFGYDDFGKRKDIIENNCDDTGTLTITVELQVATEKRSVWYPQLTSCDYTRLYKSVETSDVTVMAVSKEFQLHKNVLADRARVLYELVRTEEESSSSSSSEKNNRVVVLADVGEKTFELLIRFVYSGVEPKVDDLDEKTIKSILVAANRFGVTELKLYVESVLIEKFLVPSNAANLLLFGDSYSCGYLKEKSMDMYASNSKEVMESHEDWTKLKESNDLLVELLVYGTSDHKEYSSVVDNGIGNLENADTLNVSSLRERLQKINLDVDGSREILVKRWKEYLLANNNNNNSETISS